MPEAIIRAKKDWGLCCIRPQSGLLLVATAFLFLLALLFFLCFRAALFLLCFRTTLFLLGLAASTHVGHLLLRENAVGSYLLAVLQVQCFTIT